MLRWTLIGCLVVAPIVYAILSFGHVALEARYTVSKGETGIPGLSTWYEAHLLNRGNVPVRIQTCNFVDDVSSRGSVPAYSVEKYEAVTGQWIIVADASSSRACHPYPLGWVEAQLGTKWLWPGYELSIGEEVTAARGFHKGDIARFVIYSVYRGSDRTVRENFATPPFTIDEEAPDGGVGFRVKH